MATTRQRWFETVTATEVQINSKIPTATWLPPPYAKQQVLKFRLGTYVTPLRGPLSPLKSDWPG